MNNSETVTSSADTNSNQDVKCNAMTLRVLFDKYQEAQLNTENAKANVEVCQKAEAATIADIVKTAGTTGPFKLSNGKIVVAIKRGDGYFFRSPRKGKLIEV